MSAVVLKIKNGDDVRRVTFKAGGTFVDLQALLASLFPSELPLFVKYVDEDGDEVTIASDMELAEAVHWARVSGVLRLVVGVKSSAPKPATTQSGTTQPRPQQESPTQNPFAGTPFAPVYDSIRSGAANVHQQLLLLFPQYAQLLNQPAVVQLLSSPQSLDTIRMFVTAYAGPIRAWAESNANAAAQDVSALLQNLNLNINAAAQSATQQAQSAQANPAAAFNDMLGMLQLPQLLNAAAQGVQGVPNLFNAWFPPTPSDRQAPAQRPSSAPDARQSLHPHPLRQCARPVYASGSFMCDVCGQTGTQLCFHCDTCGTWDACATCHARANGEAVHEGVVCDACESDIFGVRYKCSVCPNYDLCHACESKNPPVHDPSHAFLKMARPAPAGRGCPYMRPGAPQTWGGHWGHGPHGPHGPHGSHGPHGPHGFHGAHRGHGFGWSGRPAGGRGWWNAADPTRADRAAQDSSPRPFWARFGGDRGDRLLARFVGDVSVEDGAAMQASSRFVKIWRMRNEGAAAWPDNTVLAFVGGDKLAEQDTVVLPGTVLPGAEIDLAVDMTAPSRPGRYISYWRLAQPDGNRFGQRVWVDILVNEEAPAAEAEPAAAPAPAMEVETPVNSAGVEIAPTASVATTEESSMFHEDVTPAVPEPRLSVMWAEELAQLQAMGFSDDARIRELLVANSGDMFATIQALLL